MPGDPSATPLDLLAAALRAKASVPGNADRPAAILWYDGKREWARVFPAARSHIPELLALGDYDPAQRTGPAIWLRCVVDGEVRVADAGGRIPILYLPGVERKKLRAAEDCPDTLRPLVELQHRGVEWYHSNGRDWSAWAFLTQCRGRSWHPGVDVATDLDTRRALLRALVEVVETPLDQLRGRILDSGDFNRIAGVEIVRDCLKWMGNPEATRSDMADERWKAFCAEARSELRFDPETEADVDAGAKLAEGAGRWRDVWSRFCEAPHRYPGIADLLVRSRAGGELVLDRDRWPDLNEEDERAVRDALAGVPDLSHADACHAVQRLEEKHGLRRQWVWAEMGRSPFAQALAPLARLARGVENSLAGQTPDEIARVYRQRGWQADEGAREALALAPAGHESIVEAVVRHLLEPWLDETAKAFQEALSAHPFVPRTAGAQADSRPAPNADVDHPAPPSAPVAAEENECILFVDGLRYDVGRGLAHRLRELGLKVEARARWAAAPTVTATAKPAVSPVADRLSGDRLEGDFMPLLDGSSRASTDRLRKSMKDVGYEIVGDDQLGIGPTEGARGWCEVGRIDHSGHHLEPVEFARAVEREIEVVATRVSRLIKDGWRSVRVVTDHGWLLLPGRLPMVSLPNHLTESKWARCAALADRARPDAPTWPWHWNDDERFAAPRGIACFSQRPHYAHGGMSLQECLIPDLRVVPSSGSADTRIPRASVRSVSWRRMRCDVQVAGADGATADLRLESASGPSVASRTKTVDADGLASLILKDHAHEDSPLVVVVTGTDGRVLAQRKTRKGQASG